MCQQNQARKSENTLSIASKMGAFSAFFETEGVISGQSNPVVCYEIKYAAVCGPFDWKYRRCEETPC